MAAASPKKPASAYFLWLNAKRGDIQTMCGSKDFATVGAKASELWKAATAAEKKPFEDEAARQKKAWEEFKGTAEGQAALEAKKAEQQEKRADKSSRAAKAAAKAVEKDERLKRPGSAYFLWFNDSRQKIAAGLGEGCKLGDVAKKGSELWNSLGEKEKAPWEKKAKEAKEAYEKFISSEEGAAALKEYKEATKAAKDEVVAKKEDAAEAAPKGRKRKAEESGDVPSPKAEESPAEPAPKGRKRKAVESAGAPSPKAEESPAEPAPKGRKRKAVESTGAPSPKAKESPAAKKAKGKGKGAKKGGSGPEPLPEAVAEACKAAQKKCREPGLNFEALLQKLLGTERIASKGVSPQKALTALETSNGLLNKAREQLLAELGA